jgi:hypothetical protein
VTGGTGVNLERTEAEIKAWITLYCTGHAMQAPVVTMHDRKWAYCRGGYLDDHAGHAWIPIEPANVNELKRRDVGFVSQSSNA